MSKNTYANAEDSFYSNPLFFRVIACLFWLQNDQETTLTNICQKVFKIRNKEGITHTSEYVTTRNVILSLESLNLVEKVQGVSKKYKTHFVVDSNKFVKFFLSYFHKLPFYMYRNRHSAMKYEVKLYSENKFAKAMVLLYFRGISIKYYELLALDDNLEMMDIFENQNMKSVILDFFRLAKSSNFIRTIEELKPVELNDDQSENESSDVWSIEDDNFDIEDAEFKAQEMFEIEEKKREERRKDPKLVFEDFLFWLYDLAMDMRIFTHQEIVENKTLSLTRKYFNLEYDEFTKGDLYELSNNPENVFNTFFWDYD